MKIICGLGNPGRGYEKNRHNVGFMVVEVLAAKLKASFSSAKFDAELAQASIGGQKVLLIKPQTWMNLSGTALAGFARFYKVEPADVLVAHDELDLPLGRLQLKLGGGTGGHNGLASIFEWWGHDGYPRLRFGIGKPEGPDAKERVVGHVLGDFTKEEAALLPELIGRGADGCQAWARDGLAKTMNQFNRKQEVAPGAPN